MNKKTRILLGAIVGLAFVLPVAYGYLRDKNLGVLNPKGMVAVEQKELLILTILLGLMVIVPVYILLFLFAWRYREGNKKAKYSPKLEGNVFAELVWWGIPLAIIVVLSVITWQTSHSLDPRKPIESTAKPLNVQVVAMNWKWLFIYPEQNVASVNHLQIPVGRPVNFEITADAPMNSFWIPQLGSQIYAMPGMSTTLHLVADEAGEYQGVSANLSGSGFAGMRFDAKAGGQSDFDSWVTSAKKSPTKLNADNYAKLAVPSERNEVELYSSVDSGLYRGILLKYMGAHE